MQLSGAFGGRTASAAASLPAGDLLSYSLYQMEQPAGLRMLANPSPALSFGRFRIRPCVLFPGLAPSVHAGLLLFCLEHKTEPGEAARSNFHEQSSAV